MFKKIVSFFKGSAESQVHSSEPGADELVRIGK